MQKICIVVSSPLTIKAFFLKHIEVLANKYDITIVVNSNIDIATEYNVKCATKYIPIERKINIFNDLKSIYELVKFFKREKFALVLSVTPKAGLVTSIAAYIAKIGKRVHYFTGQVWVTKKGLFRKVLKNIDVLITQLETNLLADSCSQKDFLIDEGIVDKSKITVLGAGSISGVDLKKFQKDEKKRKELRARYTLKENDIVFMFIGRLNKDKGIYELRNTFEKLFTRNQNAKLFIVGPDEENLAQSMKDFFNNENVTRIGYVQNPQEILNIADVLVLPSYREGFGTIVIEAAAMGIPSIGSNIYGLKDAIIHEQTGLLHQLKDEADMLKKYEFVLEHRDVLEQYSKNAQMRIVDDFEDSKISKDLLGYIDKILKAN